MTRTAARELAVQLCFRLSAGEELSAEALEDFFAQEYYETLSVEGGNFTQTPDEKQLSYIREVTQGVQAHVEELDGFIEKYAVGWKPERISKTALAVLRVALCEIRYVAEVPAGAAINEAVELAKSYDEPETVAFINGVLGAYWRGEHEGKEEYRWNGKSFPSPRSTSISGS